MDNRPLSRYGIRQILLVVVYFLVASASFNGFFLKWHLRDGIEVPALSLPKMLDGTAARPYVYRRLLPYVANGVDRVLPAGVKQRIDAFLLDDRPLHHPIALYYADTPDSRDPRYALRYYLVYAMTFSALLLAMLVLRGVCLDLGANRVSATLAPLAFALILPLLMTEGGYFYDMAELLFMGLAVRFALRAQIISLALLTALATFNKESFLFFLLTLYPFLRLAFTTRQTIGLQGVLLGIAAIINVMVKAQYASNAGSAVEVHLIENLLFLAHPLSYLRFEYNYGVLTTKGFNIINLVLMSIMVRSTWSRLALVVRQSLLIGVAINVPLFLAFSFLDELRAFSLLYVGFVMILCEVIGVCIEGADQAQEEGGDETKAANLPFEEPQVTVRTDGHANARVGEANHLLVIPVASSSYPTRRDAARK
ncbi:hypothetical protein [Paraburkholderia mimosarum]|uniref:hypothetical protein n=1 Tax=Paraburkholderia mimosarum TaxID=312026 RepID=UPI00040777A0|nr:hypothetical protein [Paraburkholderia mimosarum]